MPMFGRKTLTLKTAGVQSSDIDRASVRTPTRARAGHPLLRQSQGHRHRRNAP